MTMTYTVPLTGAEEAPTPVTTTATGTATVILNPTSGLVTVSGTFTGLSSMANNAHLHGPAAVGANAPPILQLTFDMATSGVFAGSGTLTATQVQDVLMGRTYLNVHSVNFTAGEIRGQVD